MFGWFDLRLFFDEKEYLFSLGLLINKDYELVFIKDFIFNGYELFYNNIIKVGLSGVFVLDI